MRKEIEIYEFIERYLNNQLSADELSDIQARIGSDPGFALELEKQRNIHNFINESSLIQISNELEKIHKKHSGSSKFLKGWRWLFIIAPVILLIGLFFIVQNKQFDKNENLDVIIQPDEVTHNYSPDTNNSEKNTNDTTHPRSQVQQTHIMIIPEVEPEKQQENETFPAALNDQKDSIGERAVNTIEVIQPKVKKPELNPINKTIDSTEITETLATEPCDNIKINAESRVEKSCSEKSTGKIIIDKESINGGLPPYEVSINNKGEFTNQMTFTGLFPGNYQIFIRDNNNCIQLLGNFNVESKTCSYEFVFAPDKGEVWVVPEYEVPFTLKIYSKKGINIFTKKIDYEGGLEWNGRTNNGDELPMGAYMFVLESVNKKPIYGTITLIR